MRIMLCISASAVSMECAIFGDAIAIAVLSVHVGVHSDCACETVEKRQCEQSRSELTVRKNNYTRVLQCEIKCDKTPSE